MSCMGACLSCGKCGQFEILGTFVGIAEPGGRSDCHAGYGNGFDAGCAIDGRDGYGIAIDIGTTSVVLALFNLSTGEFLARHSFMNPQRSYGPDVVSRIQAANQGKQTELNKAIIDSLSAGIAALVRHGSGNGGDSDDIKRGEIKEIVIAANTVMTHLLLGLPCESLGKYPFKPTRPLEGKQMLFGCPARIMPWLAGFIGGDILAGLLSVLPRGESCFLLIDLGTNGEIALYDKGALTVTATAAGPAFEGSGRKGGASAVLNDLAELLRSGLVDETGLLLKQDNGILPDENLRGNFNEIRSDFLLSQKEIRDIQLAKSAVRSGLGILLHTAKLEYADLEKVYLAGGIGQAMKVDDAVTIGLLPEALKEKVIAVGNASLGGAARLLLSPDSADNDIKVLLSNHSEINLAGHPLFNDLFMEYLAFSRSG